MTLTIRPMTDGDAPVVCELVQRNYEGVIAEYHSPAVVARLGAEVTPEWVRGQREWSQVFVAEDDHGIVATVALADFGASSVHRHCVRQCFVRADLHRQGIGTRIMAHVIDVARAGGADHLRLPSRRNAIPFYQRVGFVVDLEQPDAADEITWMTMELSGRPAEQLCRADAPQISDRLRSGGSRRRSAQRHTDGR